MLFIGIDLGTSACKFLLADEDGVVLRTVSEEYPLSFPKPGWSEQNPDDWWGACLRGIPRLTDGFDKNEIRALGVAGQMHGLVALDAGDCVIRPAILWNDGRTSDEVEYLNGVIGKEKLSEYTANIAFAGFTAPKLLWMKKHEPELFSKIRKIMLPKDYLTYRLTGVHATDYSDASGMLLLDVKNRRWSREMTEICGIDIAMLPRLYESYDAVGEVLPDVADLLGLPRGATVCAGAGDNAAAAVGSGTVGEGKCNISLGTSGTVFISSDKFRGDRYNALHAFCHADGGYHLMGCMLSAASCNKWWLEDILRTADYAAEGKIDADLLGKNRVFYLPYLMGERSPINDTDARAAFVGMSMDTTRADMNTAVLEGVAFALRDSIEVAKSLGIEIPKSGLCGGGAKSKLWQTILSNVLGIPLDIPNAEEGPGYGAVILSMVASGQLPDIKSASARFAAVKETVLPTPSVTEAYEKKYRQFKLIYPALRSFFSEIKE